MCVCVGVCVFKRCIVLFSFNHYCAAPNEILDLGKNHQGLQKPLEERLTGNFTMEGSDLDYLNPRINSDVKRGATSHFVPPLDYFICIKTNGIL